MRLLLLGAPGSGKGTQAERLAAHFGVPHISTGELLRDEVRRGTELGQKVAAVLAAGDLVDDELMEDLLYQPLVTASREHGGFVLDGFPRTLHQAERAFEVAAQEGIVLDAVVYLDVPHDVLLERALSRGEGRADDKPETVRHRIDVFEERTRPLVDYYAGRGILTRVDGTGTPEEIFQAILAALSPTH